MSSEGATADTRTRILEAARTLIAEHGGADVTMADIAARAKLSRQAVYLHFRDRGDLLVALVRYVDARRGLDREIAKIVNAPDGTAALRRFVALQARGNSSIWGVARALDAVRRRDDAVERSWQDRLDNRLRGCQAIIARLATEGVLRGGLDEQSAADIVWTVTSLRTWEDLALGRKWTPARYEKHVSELLLTWLTK